MMHLGSVYLIVDDFDKSIAFYEKLLETPISGNNNGRFVGFNHDGYQICLMNAHFDSENPDKIVRKGEDIWDAEGVTLDDIARAPNTQKFVFNFWTEDLQAKHKRIKDLGISDNISDIGYFRYVAPYWFFQLTDPDGNVIEITGVYTPEDSELNED